MRQIKIGVRFAALLVCCLISGQGAAQNTELSLLQADYPALYRIYKQHEAYVPALEQYAVHQGFKLPVERLATVVHEIIHVASASHQGYFISGKYFEPYVTQRSWPKLRSRDVMPHMFAGEKGIMYSVYMSSTPDNRLGNILDEVNAYSHVMPFICRYERVSVAKQATNLIGLLHIVEAYLRTARTVAPDEYTALLSNRSSSGALVTITENARTALGECGVPRSSVPSLETGTFVGYLKSK